MTSPLLNQPAPDFTAEAHNGQRVRLADYGIRIIDGAEQPKTGFTGLMFHNAAFPSYALAVPWLKPQPRWTIFRELGAVYLKELAP